MAEPTFARGGCPAHSALPSVTTSRQSVTAKQRAALMPDARARFAPLRRHCPIPLNLATSGCSPAHRIPPGLDRRVVGRPGGPTQVVPELAHHVVTRGGFSTKCQRRPVPIRNPLGQFVRASVGQPFSTRNGLAIAASVVPHVPLGTMSRHPSHRGSVRARVKYAKHSPPHPGEAVLGAQRTTRSPPKRVQATHRVSDKG